MQKIIWTKKEIDDTTVKDIKNLFRYKKENKNTIKKQSKI